MKRKIKQGRVIRSTGLGIVADVAVVAALVVVMFICVILLWHTLMASLSDGQLLSSHSGMLWWWVTEDGLPNFDGYLKTINYNDFAILKSYAITILYVIGNVVVGLVVNVTGGYVLSRPSKLQGPLTIFVIFTIIFSGGTIPTYMVIRNLGLLHTPWSLILPSCTNAMFVVMGANAFRGVPAATVEAARLDGAGEFRIMFSIMLPQAKGLFLVSAINTVTIAWNAWFEASIYVTSDPELWPLQIWIRQLAADMGDFALQTNPDWNGYLVSYCAIIISMVPILAAMPFIQKQLQKGSLTGAVKE